ncbi:MAG: metal-dependent hydrolase [Promethearchaeota archaeon]
MDLFTHFIVGAIMYTSFFGNMATDFFSVAVIFALMPDFDIILAPFRRWIKSDYMQHRGGSHSYLIGIVVSLLVNLVYSPITGKGFLLGWLIGSLFYALHISLDLLNTTKIPILYPISKKEPSFYVEKAGSLFTMILSLGFLAILITIQKLENEQLYRSASLGMLIFFAVYYLYRIILKFLVSINLGPDQKYFPAVLPIFYLIYEANISEKKIATKLVKRSPIMKERPVFDFEEEITDSEFELYQKALKLCNRDYYRNKWTKIPVIGRENNHLSFQFYFIETSMNGRGMSLSYNYDFETEKFEEKSQHYGRFGGNLN